MGDLSISNLLSGSPSQADSPAKIRQAAQEFEGLMIEQLLHASREGEGGWLGTGEDASASCATDYAEQHVAMMLAKQGGLGLARLIGQGLEAKAAKNTGGESRPGSVP
jgi:Rod binding domain-containing protein